MTLEFHPEVQTDFAEALAYYQLHGGTHLADRFGREFQNCLAAIKAGPTRFPFLLKSDRFRRIRFKGFPYLIVYREHSTVVRVTTLRHEKRHPHFGVGRQWTDA
jgi:plasmid stabilization system protein ParE